MEEIIEKFEIKRDQLAGLIDSFNQAADETFHHEMTEQVLGSNWSLSFDSTVIRDEVRFREVADTPSKFRDLIATRVEALAYRHLQHAIAARLAVGGIRDGYLESYSESHVGSFTFALWFYRFDQDNWFSHDRYTMPLRNI